MRSRGLTAAVVELEPEQPASTERLIASGISAQRFIWLILSLHPAFSLQDRFQRMLGFFRQVIRLAVCGILARTDIGAERLGCVRDEGCGICVAAYEFG